MTPPTEKKGIGPKGWYHIVVYGIMAILGVAAYLLFTGQLHFPS